MEKALRSASEESIKILHEWKSLQAHYQALCVEQMTNDEDMLKMINLLDDTRLQWKNSVMENYSLKSTNESLENETKKVNIELSTTRDKLRESQAQIAALLLTSQSLEREIEEYKKRFDVVKKILREQNSRDVAYIDGGYSSDNPMGRLMELPFLKNDNTDESSTASPENDCHDSHTNTEEIDYDKTGDTFGEGLQSDNDTTSDDKNAYNQRKRSQRLVKSRQVKNFERNPARRRSVSQQPSPLVSSIKLPVNGVTKRTVQSIVEEGRLATIAEPSPPKRSKGGRDDGFYIETNKGKTPQGTTIRRSISEANLLSGKALTMFNRGFTASTLHMRSPMLGFGSTWTRGRPIAECTHTFKIEKFNLLGSCAVCLKSFSNSCYKSFRCIDCKCSVHEWCTAQAPTPCVPAIKTPQLNQKHRPRLADFCPESRPKIPALVVRCVVALETKYLNTIGLYRVPGAESEIKKLLDAFHSGIPPNLANRDPETICGSIKRFLRELREPLIPTSSYEEFVRAVEENGREQLISVVAELPIPNRDTLAYLCCHWQNVAHNSNVNQMPIENLATCLGPTIVGSSSKFGCLQNNARVDQHLETRRQNEVLLHLLRLDQSYWTEILNSPSVIGCLSSTAHRTAPPSVIRRPLRELDADKSFLGPVTKTVSKNALIQPLPFKNVGTPTRAFFERPY